MNIVNPKMNSYEDHKNREKETVHHILPTSRAGSQIEENKIRLYQTFHNNFHSIFGNLTIDEQLQKILSISYTGLRKDFLYDIEKVLRETDKTYYYKDGIYLKKHF